jgi:hypothetical protein
MTITYRNQPYWIENIHDLEMLLQEADNSDLFEAIERIIKNEKKPLSHQVDVLETELRSYEGSNEDYITILTDAAEGLKALQGMKLSKKASEKVEALLRIVKDI